MIIECEACLANIQDKPKYYKSKVGFADYNGETFIVVINSKSRQKFRIKNITKLHKSAICFKDPKLNLMIKNGDQQLIHVFFNHIKNILKGEKVQKLPAVDKIKEIKSRPISVNQVGNDYDLKIFQKNIVNKLSIKEAQIISKKIWKLNSLVELNINDCELKEVSKNFKILGQTLKILNLSNNSITKVDPEFFIDLPNLVSLNLSNNQINFLPAEIHLLKKLIKLDISKNRLRNIPYSILYLNNLTELNVSFNRIKIFSHAIWCSLKLKTKLLKLDITENFCNKLIIPPLDPAKKKEIGFPNLKQLTSNKVLNHLNIIFRLREYMPKEFIENLNKNLDLCSNCNRAFSNEFIFYKLRPINIVELANFSVMNDLETINLCYNLCNLCSINYKPTPN